MVDSSAGFYRYVDLVKQQTKRIQGMSAGERAAQLGYSSLDDSMLPVLDVLGQVRMQIGRQPDATFAVTYRNGDPPPVPTDPIVAPREGAVLVGWDGLFAGGYERPGDFARVDIHISETEGFVPDGSTVVGYLLGEAATLVPIDHTDHYVTLVAVTLSDVISAPAGQQHVLPEPVGQIAAGAIGAQQLATEIVLVENSIIVGDPDSARLSFNSAAGLELYAPDGTRTVHFDNATGNAEITGTIRTAASGVRMVWQPDLASHLGSAIQGVQFFNGDTTYENNPAVLYAANAYVQRQLGNVSGYAPALWMSGPLIGDLRSAVSVSDIVEIQLADIANGAQHADFRMTELGVTATAGIAYGDAGGSYQWNTWYGYLEVANPQIQEVVYSPTAMFGYAANNANGTYRRFGFVADYKENTCYVFSGNGLGVTNQGGTGWTDVTARSFIETSSREVKTDIAALPSSPLAALRTAPVSRFRYATDDPDAEPVVGVMAEDLPEWLTVTVDQPDGLTPAQNAGASTLATHSVRGVNVASQVGWLAAAVRELDMELDAVRELLPPGRRKKLPDRTLRRDAT